MRPPLNDRGASLPWSARFRQFQPLLGPLLLAFSALLLALAFAKLGGEVAEGDTRSFDAQMLHWAQGLRAGRPWLVDVMRDLSGLGSTAVLGLFTVATVGYLALVSARATAILVAMSVVSGTVLVSVIKAMFGRLRPDAASAEFVEKSLSFPSGHASLSALVFLTLGALMAWTHRRWAARTYILMVAALMTGLVGLSRIGLGIHWATDVLGGWAFGAAWAILWLLVARRIARQNGEGFTGSKRRWN